MTKHFLTRGLLQFAAVALLAGGIMGAHLAAPQAVHAASAPHVSTNILQNGCASNSNGLWVTEICVNGPSRTGTYAVHAYCWVNPWPKNMYVTIYYSINCSLFNLPPGGSWNVLDWQQTTTSENYGGPSPAAELFFPQYGSAAYWTWQVEITRGDISESLGDTYGHLQSAPTNPPVITTVEV